MQGSLGGYPLRVLPALLPDPAMRAPRLLCIGLLPALLGAPTPAEATDPAPAAGTADPAPLSPACQALAEGRQALGAKRLGAAKVALERCLTSDPTPDEAADCHWELGWAHWLRGDWSAVVSAWTAVEAADPGREGLSRYLSQARDNLGLDALLEKGRSAAPKTFRSEVPDGTTVRLRAVGDLMIGTTFPAGALNPEVGETFADVGEWIRDADVTFGNLEGPLCDTGTTKKCKPDQPPGRCYAFKSPGSYRDLYKEVGFDVMSTANNHAGDFGQACRTETEAHLDAVGIAHSGRPGDIASLTVNGLKVAVIGFHTSRNSHYVNDHDTARDLVRAVDQDHDLVVVSFHGGAEGSKALHVPEGQETFYGENRGDLRTFTHAVIDAGADLVLGHGPHVLRGAEVYNGRLIAYSLGNFATYGRFNLSGNLGVGAVLEVTLDRDGAFVSGKVLPTKQVGEGIPMKDPDGKAIDLMRTLSADDFPGTAVQVAQDGSLQGPG